jgi:hypothetical protein
VYAKLLKHIRILGIKVETHLTQPVEGFGTDDTVFDKHTSDVTLMNQFSDLRKKAI